MNPDREYKIARTISSCCEAPLLAIVSFFIINLFLDWQNFLVIEGVSLLFATILPIAFFLSWGKLKGIDKDYTDRTKRNIPLLVAVVIYLIGGVLLYYLNANPITTILMFCYALNTFIVFAVNLKWKISIHAIGVSGPTVGLLFVHPLGFILGLVAPFIMWSRLVLKKHTPEQLLAGSLVGYVFTLIPYYLILNKINSPLTLSQPSKVLVIVLMVISVISYLVLRKKRV